MIFDIDMIKKHYSNFSTKVNNAKKNLKKPLTVAEKILYAHLFDENELKDFARGEDYVNFAPDRVAMQDATAQMALLQFMQAGRPKVAVPSTVHCDHLIIAKEGASKDLAFAKNLNKEVYDFLESVSNKYGIGFWKPGAGIIHQVVFQQATNPKSCHQQTNISCRNCKNIPYCNTCFGNRQRQYPKVQKKQYNTETQHNPNFRPRYFFGFYAFCSQTG